MWSHCGGCWSNDYRSFRKMGEFGGRECEKYFTRDCVAVTWYSGIIFSERYTDVGGHAVNTSVSFGRSNLGRSDYDDIFAFGSQLFVLLGRPN
jgi:hypothetical protein